MVSDSYGAGPEERPRALAARRGGGADGRVPASTATAQRRPIGATTPDLRDQGLPRYVALLLALRQRWYLLVPQHLGCKLLQLRPSQGLHACLVRRQLHLDRGVRDRERGVEDRDRCALPGEAAEIVVVERREQRGAHLQRSVERLDAGDLAGVSVASAPDPQYCAPL